jgi:hypothetical protein
VHLGIGGLLPVPAFAAAAAAAGAPAASSLVPTCFTCVNGMVAADFLKDAAEYKEV